MISKPGGLVAQKCIFGWVLSGPLPPPPRSMNATSQFSYYAQIVQVWKQIGT